MANTVTEGEEKAEVLNTFFASVLNSMTSYPQGNWPPKLGERDGEQHGTPEIQVETEELTKPLSSIHHQSWLIGAQSQTTGAANVRPIYKGWKENPGNSRPVSLTLVPSKVMEQITLSVITQLIWDNQGIRLTEHRSPMFHCPADPFGQLRSALCVYSQCPTQPQPKAAPGSSGPCY